MNLTTEYSLWFLPLCILLGVLAAFVLYRQARKRYEWASWLVALLSIARASAIALMAFFLLGPLLKYLQTEEQKPIVVIAHDGSSSITSAADSVAVKGQLIDALKSLQAELGEDHEVRTFTYGDEVREGINGDQSDKQTDMGALFREIRDRYDGLNLGAIILDSDGIYNRGRDPIYAAENLGVPIYTIALGDTTIRTDLILSEVDHNRITYKGNEFPLLVRYRADHLSGQRTLVTVSEGGKELVRKEVFLKGDPAIGEIPLLVTATEAGIKRYVVSLRTIQGEVNTSNNSTAVYIEVLDDRQKVLILAKSPHPDVAAIGDALSTNENYEVVRRTIGDLDVKPEDFDLLILHQLPDRKTPKNLLANARSKNVPTWYLVGGGNDLSKLENEPGGIRISGANGSVNDVQADVANGFETFKLDQKERTAIRRFPPMQVPFGEHSAKASFVTVLEQRVGAVNTDYPLLSLGEESGTRYAVLHGEGIWRWRIYDRAQNGSQEVTNKLINKVAQYLAVKEDKSRFRVNTEQRFDENERITFSAELYNENYEAVNDPEVELQLTDEEGNSSPYAFSRLGEGYRLDAGVLAAGRYAYAAKTELNGKTLTARGEFTIRALLAEQVDLVADHGLLESLSERSGGKMVYLNEAGSLVKRIGDKKEVVTRQLSRSVLNDLVELRWIFFILLALLTLEWALRRRNGAY